jgi:hypothetical protein
VYKLKKVNQLERNFHKEKKEKQFYFENFRKKKKNIKKFSVLSTILNLLKINSQKEVICELNYQIS